MQEGTVCLSAMLFPASVFCLLSTTCMLPQQNYPAWCYSFKPRLALSVTQQRSSLRKNDSRNVRGEGSGFSFLGKKKRKHEVIIHFIFSSLALDFLLQTPFHKKRWSFGRSNSLKKIKNIGMNMCYHLLSIIWKSSTGPGESRGPAGPGTRQPQAASQQNYGIHQGFLIPASTHQSSLSLCRDTAKGLAMPH